MCVADCVWPGVDLAVSRLFAEPGQGFVFSQSLLVVGLEKIAFYGARLLGMALAVCAVFSFWRRAPALGLSAKAWAFLLLGLLLGPGLVANVVFKDNWGRARPREIVEFGGSLPYSPPLVISSACDKNCSFISGDAAFGFFLPSFAYVVSRRKSRRAFWAGVAAGCVFGLARVIGGAHFLSDVLFAALFMLLVTALLHALMFGAGKTRERWRLWASGLF